MLKFDKLRFYLQAIRTVLWARKCSLFTTMITSVRMSLLRRRFRFRRTSLACRVNWIQLSVADVIFAPILKHKEKRKKATFKGRIYNTRTSFQVKALLENALALVLYFKQVSTSTFSGLCYLWISESSAVMKVMKCAGATPSAQSIRKKTKYRHLPQFSL